MISSTKINKNFMFVYLEWYFSSIGGMVAYDSLPISSSHFLWQKDEIIGWIFINTVHICRWKLGIYRLSVSLSTPCYISESETGSASNKMQSSFLYYTPILEVWNRNQITNLKAPVVIYLHETPLQTKRNTTISTLFNWS